MLNLEGAVMHSTLDITELYQYGERVSFKKEITLHSPSLEKQAVIFISYPQASVLFHLFLAMAKKLLTFILKSNNLLVLCHL